MNRRTVITILGTGLVSASGCFGLESKSNPEEETELTWAPPDVADVQFFNHTSKTLTVTLRATADGEKVVEKTFSVPSGDTAQEDKEYEEFSRRRTLTVHIAVEDGPSGSHEFEDSKDDARTLNVDLYPESIEFQVSAA